MINMNRSQGIIKNNNKHTEESSRKSVKEAAFTMTIVKRVLSVLTKAFLILRIFELKD